MDGVRKTYDGPLALARDLMVINVTKDTMKVRMATVDEYVLPPDVTSRMLSYCRSSRRLARLAEVQMAAVQPDVKDHRPDHGVRHLPGRPGCAPVLYADVKLW